MIFTAIKFIQNIYRNKGDDCISIQYNESEIGKRIRAERKAAGFKSAENFGNELGIGRSQVEQIEQGKRLPALDTLVKMTEMFNCEVGYLLCEPGYECKTRTKTDIQRETGLSEPAISILHRMNTISDNGPFPKDLGEQYIRLYSAFICNLKVMGMTQIAIPNILRIRENGLSEAEEDIFNNPSEAISFYTFQMQNVILDFLQDYFKDEIVDDPFTE